jgi:hypothetical protein
VLLMVLDSVFDADVVPVEEAVLVAELVSLPD